LVVAAEDEFDEEGIERSADGEAFGGGAVDGEVVELVGDGVAEAIESGRVEGRGAGGQELRGVLLEGGGGFLAGADEDSFDEHADEGRVAVLAIAVEEPSEGFGIVDEGLYGDVLKEERFAMGGGKGGMEDDEVDVGGGRALAAHEGAGDEGGVGVRVTGCEDFGGEGENVAGSREGHGFMLPRRGTAETDV
jgi:hypothetical protein